MNKRKYRTLYEVIEEIDPQHFEEIQRDATISECGKYRTFLSRSWDDRAKQVFVMLNPSTADANNDDPTIRRCIGFAKREGAGGLIVSNLFNLRSTDPKFLKEANDPIGPYTESLQISIKYAQKTNRPIIAAWGANSIAKNQARKFCQMARNENVKLVCLGVSKSGSPKHPLYIKKDTPLVEYIFT